MSGMKISIEGAVGPRLRGRPHRWLFGEFIKHLKMLRDEPNLHHDFFSDYVFDDNKEPPAKAEEGQANAQQALPGAKPQSETDCG